MNFNVTRNDGLNLELSGKLGRLKINLKTNNTENQNEKEILIMDKKPSILITVTEDAEIIEEIAKKTQARLLKENNINISSSAAIPTIICQFLRTTVDAINENKSKGDVNINLFHILDMGVTYREDTDGEKEGNFTPYTQAGQDFKLGIKDDKLTEE